MLLTIHYYIVEVIPFFIILVYVKQFTVFMAYFSFNKRETMIEKQYKERRFTIGQRDLDICDWLLTKKKRNDTEEV